MSGWACRDVFLNLLTLLIWSLPRRCRARWFLPLGSRFHHLPICRECTWFYQFLVGIRDTSPPAIAPHLWTLLVALGLQVGLAHHLRLSLPVLLLHRYIPSVYPSHPIFTTIWLLSVSYVYSSSLYPCSNHHFNSRSCSQPIIYSSWLSWTFDIFFLGILALILYSLIWLIGIKVRISLCKFRCQRHLSFPSHTVSVHIQWLLDSRRKAESQAR